ncbi:monovalent cation:proton antiporter-2 (CPA2) family protein [Oryzifoliimicrobium ureilyticus]|uniref:monovalent cation:proton antiporter-2 (CPA2) family protein n=1 Tax=Oryzifoliimicrobium ureilyticus TaxID=3113724 RepID=UPI0030764DAA
MTEIIFQAFIYLMAAVVSVLIAKRLGLGSVLGYLIAGIVIGPALHLVGNETQDLQHFAEFGVVMMLFLVGLELQPRALWEMRSKLLGLGGLQVVVTSLVIMGCAMLLGQVWSVALTVGFIFSLSSTAIVLQTLGEKGLLRSSGGQSSFSVLLFQDIAVIPMLALIPLLALPELTSHRLGGSTENGGHHSLNLVDGLPGWQVTLVTIFAVAFVVAAGHYLSRPIFRLIAHAKLREIFTAAALLLIIGIALLMTMVGLSPALGTFLAGVVLANSEFRHELESDIEPFKGLLLGLFFITVGASIDFSLLYAQIWAVLGITLGMMALKAIVLLALSFIFKLRGIDRWLFALGLAQAGEFGFVLISFTVQSAVLPESLASILLLVVAVSMLLTPGLFIIFDRLIVPRFDRRQEEQADEISERGSVIIAGLGRFGQIVNRMLLANGYKTIVLDHQADVIDGLRKFGIRSFFGDASRPDLLHSAGLHDAKVLVVAIDDPERAVEIVKHARRENPHIHIIARAFDRTSVYRLYEAGAHDIVREVFDSSVRAAGYALQGLGMHPYDVEKSKRVFVRQDGEGLRTLAPLWREDVLVFNNKEYVAKAKEINDLLEKAMMGDRGALGETAERGWTPPDVAAEKLEKKSD